VSALIDQERGVNMNIKQYEELSDRLPNQTLHKMFEDVLRQFKRATLSKEDFFEILIELMNRQVYTYEALAPHIQNELDDLISRLWNVDNYSEIDIMLSLIINLSLEKSFSQVKLSIANNLNIPADILEEIQGAIEEHQCKYH